MNQRDISVCRRAQSCWPRVEVLEDRSVPAGIAGSPLLPAPDSPTPVHDPTESVPDLVSPVTAPVTRVAEELSPGTQPVPGPVNPGPGAGEPPAGPGSLPGELIPEPSDSPPGSAGDEVPLPARPAAEGARPAPLPDLSSGTGSAPGQPFVLPRMDSFSVGREARDGAGGGGTDETRSEGNAAGDTGEGAATGRSSAQGAGAGEEAEPTPGPEEEEQVPPPTPPLNLLDLLGPASGVIDEFFPLDPAVWGQATEQFFADLPELAEEGSRLAPWVTVITLLGLAYELARRDLRRLQAQQASDFPQVPESPGFTPAGEP